MAASSTSTVAPTPTSFQINQDEPQVYTGDSIAYFKQKFFKGESSSLTSGEGNAVPIAKDLNITTKKFATYTGKVIATDEDAGDKLSYYFKTQPTNGTVTLNPDTGEFTYVGYEAGTYTFSFFAMDSRDYKSNTATVTIVVENGTTPVTQSLNIQAKINTSVIQGKLQAIDPDENDLLYYELLSEPNGGSLTLNKKTGDFEFSGYEVGTYTFTYQVTDSQHNVSDPATVTIVIEKEKDKDKDKNKNNNSQPTTTTPVTTSPTQPSVTPPTTGDITIDAVHTDNNQSTQSNPNGRTRGVATLSASSTEQNAVLNVLSDRIANTIKEAQAKQNIAIDASILKDKQQYQLNFAGNVVKDLLSKQNGLTLQTGDLSVQLPSAVLSRITGLQNLSTTDAAQWTLTAQKVNPPALPNWNGAAFTPTSSTAYNLTLGVSDAGTNAAPSTYENRYVKLGVAVPEAATDQNSYVALATDASGNTYPVPVTFDAQGQATVHMLEGSTVQIVKVAAPATTNSSPAIQLLEQKQIIPFVDRAPSQSDSSLTRGELALYLSRALGVNTASVTSSTFTDLGTASEESRAIEALYQAGVLKGISSSQFAPDRVISREQLAVILTRAASAYGLSEEGAAASGGTSTTSSKWAQDELTQALAQGNNTGIVSSGNASLTAQPNVSKSEGAQTLVGWLQGTNLVN